MKKGIMIFLSVLVLAIGGFFFVNIVVDAEGAPNDQKMSIDIEGESTNVYYNSISTVNLKINTGEINGASDKKVLENTINRIKVDMITGINLVGAKVRYKNFRTTEWIERELDVVNNIIDIGPIKYINTEDPDNKDLRFVGPEMYVQLRFEINTEKAIDLNKRLKIEYDTLQYINNPKVLERTFEKKHLLNVLKLNYKIGTIQGLKIKEASENDIKGNTIHMGYPLNRYFTMQYKVNEGEISIDDSNGSVISPSNFQSKNRELIYVVDKSVLDLKGGNEETARESMIKSLEILKEEGAKINGYLILLGKKAEVIEVNKKSLLSIDELINQISKAEGTLEAGNLGDGVRRAQMISDKNVENDSSVVLVTNGNPNYYTQVSQGQKSLLYTRVDKDGHNEKDRELADKYANEVVNDIVVNENDNTRWYSVNYGERTDELVVDELIKKLDGYALRVQAPYYDDFIRINEKAVSPIILKGKIIAKVNEKYKNSIVVASEDKEQNIELIFDSKANEVKANQIEFDIKAKIIDGGEMEELGFDVADSEVIEVKFIVDSYDKQEHIFNKVLDPSLTNSELLIWRVKPTIPYVARMGLFNGNLTANLNSLSDKKLSTEDLLSLAQVSVIANNSLDELDMCDLAINNEFGYGMVIKPKVEDTIRPIIKENGKIRDLGNEGVFSLYKLNTQTNRFEKIAGADAAGVKLEGNQIYLITIDMMVQERFLNQSFEIGVEVNSSWKEEVTMPDGNESVESQVEVLNDSVKEYWTIKVNGVAQPEHF